MKALNIFFLFLLFSINSNSQIITTKQAEISIGPTIFNSEVIKQNKIKKIDVTIVDKPDGEIIVDKGSCQGYRFDSLGRLTGYYYTIQSFAERKVVDVPEVRKKGRVTRPATTKTITKYFNDTIFAYVFYDNQNRIILKRIKSGDFYDAYYYEYGDQDQIKKEMHFRETSISEIKNEFKLGVQKLLSSETYEYVTLAPGQVKKVCLNDEGREYKKAIINYGEKGIKLSERYEYNVSWLKQENQFKYDASGKLIEQTCFRNDNGEIKECTSYQYNPTGVLLEEKKFQNDVLLNEISYLYDENNNLVKSKVSRDHKNASIGIIKYGYSFY